MAWHVTELGETNHTEFYGKFLRRRPLGRRRRRWEDNFKMNLR